MTAVRGASLEAPAKVNLFLRVLHRRPDGYREIETLFQMLRLADEVRVEYDTGGPFREVTLVVEGPDLGPVEENLAVRAARSFLEASGAEGAVHVELTKRIPAGGGLGGGSSDAAAVLRLLRHLTSGPSSAIHARRLEDPELHGIASDLGSDVPFFLASGSLALGRGRGEVLTPLEALPSAPVVLALPPVHVDTARAYRALSTSRSGGPEEPPRPGDPGSRRCDADLATGLDWASVAALAENDFESLIAGLHEPVERSLTGLRAAGAEVALLSGSGGASFGVFPSAEHAREAAARLEAEHGWPFVATATRESAPDVQRG